MITYYLDKDDKQIGDTLEQLFTETCKIWYESRIPTPKSEQGQVYKWYRKDLKLYEPSQVEELKLAFNRLLTQKLSGLKEFKIENSALIIQLEGRDLLTLPNPVNFVMEEYSSLLESDFFPIPSKVAITHGDLHANNILVNKQGQTWLIDFYKTGLGVALRDFVELESDIKFNLMGTLKLRLRYDLEIALLSPRTLTEEIQIKDKLTPEQSRALAAIQRLRKLAELVTDTMEVREYYMGLLFFALKRIVGFTSSGENMKDDLVAKYHAVISAALICQYLNPISKNQTLNPAKIFISYTRSDERSVSDLYEKLSQEGFSPWLDKKNIQPGEVWDLAIKKAIRESDFFLACLSSESVGRRGVLQKEIKDALEIWREKLDDDIYLIPVRLEKCEIPENLKKFHCADIFEEDGLDRLVEGIKEGVNRLGNPQ